MIPKVIWTYLSKPHQGFTHSPELLNITRKNWKKFAPNYEIKVIDEFNVCYYLQDSNMWNNLDEKYPIKPVFVSDIIRLALLVKYGGTYMDANVMLLDDLENILGNKGTLFTSFNTDSHDPIFENWFVSCEKNDSIITKWLDEVMKAKTDIDTYIESSTEMAKFYMRDMDISSGINGGIGFNRYLTCHFAMRNVYENNKNDFNKFKVFNGGDTAFYNHINKSMNDTYMIDKDKICIKFRSADRKTLDLDKIPKVLYE